MSVEPAQIGSTFPREESLTLEYKKSTAQLKAAAETLCAFLNTNGGEVIIGVTPKERNIVGQQVSDKTRQVIANTLRQFEPRAPISVEYKPTTDSSKTLIVLQAEFVQETRPYTFGLCP